MSPKLFPRAPLAGILLAHIAGVISAAAGADFNGSAVIATTATDNLGLESHLFEQQYTLGLFQRLTPYVSLRFGYQHLDLTTTFEEGTDSTRRARQPLLELLYSRPRLTGRVAFSEQAVENTLQAESFDRRSLAASLSWRPNRWPGFAANFRDEANIADVSVFGADVSSRLLELTTFYNLGRWAASYNLEQISLDNRSNDLHSEQRRHEARASGSQSFWANRVSLGLSGRLGRLSRNVQVGTETELAEPISSVEGLFAVDTTPEIGELEPHPTLIDGEIDTPASPPIDIGGANTFRNVGVDLGITRPVSRLEIAVDTVSGPGLVWQVYRSRDNLIWESVSGVTSVFDAILLRYRIQFPETEDRFFKAVNVSVNPASVVRVTEVRALLELDPADAAQDSENTLYRAAVAASFRPPRKVPGAVGDGLSNDETLTAGLVRRDFSDTHALARLSVEITEDLDLDLGYRFNDSESLGGPVLLRTVNQHSASLRWNPLPTLDAVLTAGRRSESAEGDPIQSLRSVRLGLVTQLLPDLRLVTDLDLSRLEDPFAGRDRNSLTWRETLEMRPFRTWTVSGSLSSSTNTAPDGTPLLRRTHYRLWTTWNATAFLTLGGTWWYAVDDGRGSLNQSYNLAYAPGDRLTISATYQGFEDSRGRGTFTDNLNLTYRLFARLVLFARLSRSRTEESSGETSQISNLRTGLRFSF